MPPDHIVERWSDELLDRMVRALRARLTRQNERMKDARSGGKMERLSATDYVRKYGEKKG